MVVVETYKVVGVTPKENSNACFCLPVCKTVFQRRPIGKRSCTFHKYLKSVQGQFPAKLWNRTQTRILADNIHFLKEGMEHF